MVYDQRPYWPRDLLYVQVAPSIVCKNKGDVTVELTRSSLMICVDDTALRKKKENTEHTLTRQREAAAEQMARAVAKEV